MHLKSIRVYPIKSLDGVEVKASRILAEGALQYDREFSFKDSAGKIVRGKREPRLILVRANYDLAERTVDLQAPGMPGPAAFHLDGDRSGIEEWMSSYLGYRVTLQQNGSRGFPDDKDLSGPSLVSCASLAEVQTWFDSLSEAETRKRFRMNLEVGGAPAWWEDELYAAGNGAEEIRAGDVTLKGATPLDRCIIVTVHPETGAPFPDFQRTFMARRSATVVREAVRAQLPHFFMLGVRTSVPASEVGKTLCSGDPVDVLR